MRPSVLWSTLLGLALALPAGAQSLPPAPADPDPLAAVPGDADPAEAQALPPPASEGGAPAVPSLDRADLEAWLDGFLPYALRRGDIAGAVVVVVKDGEVMLQKGYGWSDLAARTPVDPENTLFRPGSVSKLFTWTAVMQLVEQGKLDLDADVNQYLDFTVPPRNGEPVTLRHVMTHTTGMEEQIRGLIASDPDAIVPLGEALKHWVPERIYDAGSTPAYSNYATAMAGYIVQRVSGESFYDYVDKHIFDPLGMQQSSFRQPLPPALLAKVSKGYDLASSGEPKDYEFISLAPAGSLAATGADMGRFMIAHLQHGQYRGARILAAETAERMHRTAQASIPPLNRMMLGFYETSVNGHRAIAHGGDTQWFHSDLQLFPDDGIGIFISVNSNGREGAPGQIRNTLMDAFADRYLPATGDAAAPAEGVDEATAREHAAMMAGNYDNSRRAESNFMSLVYLMGQTSVVVNEDGTISVPMLTDLSGAPRKWRETGPWLWRDVAGEERLAAQLEDGRVVRFSVDSLAPIMEFHKVAWWQSSALLLPLMFGSLAVLALTVLAWPVSAMVRRYYRATVSLPAADIKARRRVRLAALAALLSFGGLFGLLVAMMSSLDLMGPGSDGLIIAMRLLVSVALPVCAVLGLLNAWHVLRGRRRLAAKAWALVLAFAFLCLLWIGVAYHLVGFGANY